MKKRLALLALSLLVSSCALMSRPNVVPDPMPIASSSELVSGDEIATPEPSASAEVSRDPIVRLLTSPRVVEDTDVALKIAGDSDPELTQCLTWLRAKANELRTSPLIDTQVLSFAPVKPVGLISGLAEKRRIGRDLRSGDFARRIADARKRIEDLRTEANMACAPLIADERQTILRLTALVGLGLP